MLKFFLKKACNCGGNSVKYICCDIESDESKVAEYVSGFSRSNVQFMKPGDKSL